MVAFPFEISATDGAARTGVLQDPARRHPHAGLHAGRHRRHGQGADGRPGQGDRRRHHPGQHLPPDAAAHGRAGEAAGRPAPVHALGQADPDRQRRLPGDDACRRSARSRRRPSPSPSHIDGSQARAERPSARWRSRPTCWAADIVMQLDECVAWPAEERRARQAHASCRPAGASAPRPRSATRDSQALFGIQQGSTFRNLRQESSDRLTGDRLRRLRARRPGRGRGT